MRRIIVGLMLGLVAGYFLGFFDAYRGAGTLGAHVYDLVDRIHPDNVARQRQRESDRFRDQVHQAAAVADSAVAQRP